MKPLKLTLQAFGPFAASEQVDFTLMGSNPLFLINGPTGAGKSYILDGICFALYGHTTGAERDPSQMRCDFAEPTVMTEVSLDFSLGNKQYRVRRVPAQEKPKKHSEGTTVQAAEAQLWELDDSDEGKLLVSKSVNDANDAISALIGLDIDQFRQVMVLPQGKFRDLLLADSRDREKIFSQLFQTSIYKRIEERLRSKASGIRQAVENHQNLIRGILEAAEVNTEAEVADELLLLSPKLKSAEDNRSKAEKDKKTTEVKKDQAKQLIERLAELSQKESQLKEKRLQEAEMKGLHKRLEQALAAQKIQPLFANSQAEKRTLEKIQQELAASSVVVTEAAQRHETAGLALELAKKNAAEVNALNRQQLKLEALGKRNSERQQAQQKLSEAESSWNASDRLLKSGQHQEKNLLDELDGIEKSNQLLLLELERLAPKQVALEKLGIQLEQRKELEKLRRQFINEKETVTSCQQQYHLAEEAFKLAETTSKKIEMGWHAGQAALLARELKDAEPCPVCGSKQHPAPALVEGAGELIEKIAVDQARVARDEARNHLDNSSKLCDRAVNSLAETSRECEKLELKLVLLADQGLNVLESACKQAMEEVQSLLAKQRDQKKQQARLEEIKAEQAILKKNIDQLQRQAGEANQQVLIERTRVEQLLSEVPVELREADTLSAKLAAVISRINELTAALQLAEKVVATARSDVDKSSSHHAALEKQSKQQKKKAEEANKAWISALHNSQFSSHEDFLSALLDDEEQASIKVTIENYRSAIDSLQGAIKQINADVGDKVKPDLGLIEAALAEKTATFNLADVAWRELDTRNNQLKEIRLKLDRAHEKNAALEDQYKVIGTLSDVANGQTGNKISLQRFVLSVLLDDVLIQASQRLLQMSKGRYQLIRKEDRAKGNKASGLELEVEDGYSGKVRSVATLSGGESFMAALSLALGLSDVVQSYAGGIKLDTLFIDEGFGSLDPESLDLAIRTLIDLQASGRMIGIISHVSELKEQMALRLDVLSGRDGSHIATVAV